jgi:hypothetical protein
MRGRYLLGLVILIAAISIGCGRGSGTHQDVPAGQLSVSPSTLDFGKVREPLELAMQPLP